MLLLQTHKNKDQAKKNLEMCFLGATKTTLYDSQEYGNERCRDMVYNKTHPFQD
jgi:hypothetical protein